MSNNSGIEWTDATWNPLSGCTRVSPGCQNCYAEKMARRLCRMAETDIVKGRRTGGKAKYLDVLDPHGRWNGKINLDEKALVEPLRWRKPRRVFVNSMSDLFHPGVPFEFIDKVFAVMALCPQHTFQVLTKRPERAAEYLNRRTSRTEADGYVCKQAIVEAVLKWHEAQAPSYETSNRLPIHPLEVAHRLRVWETWPLPNVWLGTSPCDQKTADELIPHLLRCPAAVRFLSCEPLLGAVDLTQIPTGHWSYGHVDVMSGYLCGDEPDELHDYKADPNGWVRKPAGEWDRGRHAIHWVIVGGESGAGARPCNVEWVRSIVGQCKAAGVPVFVKQLGAWIRHGTHDPCPRCTQANCLHRVKMDDGSVMFHRGGKGGDSSEWPVDLRVREFPAIASEVTP